MDDLVRRNRNQLAQAQGDRLDRMAQSARRHAGRERLIQAQGYDGATQRQQVKTANGSGLPRTSTTNGAIATGCTMVAQQASGIHSTPRVKAVEGPVTKKPGKFTIIYAYLLDRWHGLKTDQTKSKNEIWLCVGGLGPTKILHRYPLDRFTYSVWQLKITNHGKGNYNLSVTYEIIQEDGTKDLVYEFWENGKQKHLHQVPKKDGQSPGLGGVGIAIDPDHLGDGFVLQDIAETKVLSSDDFYGNSERASSGRHFFRRQNWKIERSLFLATTNDLKGVETQRYEYKLGIKPGKTSPFKLDAYVERSYSGGLASYFSRWTYHGLNIRPYVYRKKGKYHWVAGMLQDPESYTLKGQVSGDSGVIKYVDKLFFYQEYLERGTGLKNEKKTEVEILNAEDIRSPDNNQFKAKYNPLYWGEGYQPGQPIDVDYKTIFRFPVNREELDLLDNGFALFNRGETNLGNMFPHSKVDIERVEKNNQPIYKPEDKRFFVELKFDATGKYKVRVPIWYKKPLQVEVCLYNHDFSPKTKPIPNAIETDLPKQAITVKAWTHQATQLDPGYRRTMDGPIYMTGNLLTFSASYHPTPK